MLSITLKMVPKNLWKVAFRQFQSKRSKSTTAHLVRPITVRTCVGLYTKLHALNSKLYPRNAPESLDLTVEYADTANDSTSSSVPNKTILAIHGNPGYHSHFEKILSHYRGSHVRVIAPTLPDFSHTRTHGFWHHTEEKAAFVRDFLEQLGVKRIDCLVSHSMGFQTLAAICEKPGNLLIGSTAIFAPQPTWDVSSTEKRIVHFMFALKSLLWYDLMQRLQVHRFPFWPMKFTSINECLWLFSHVLDEQSPVEIHRRIEHLRERVHFPVAVLYGTKESIVSKRSVQKIYSEFGIEERQMIHLDPDVRKDVTKITSDGPRIKGYLLKNGGHFAHMKHHEIAIGIIESLLNRDSIM